MLSLVALGAHHFRKRARNLAAGRTAEGAPAHSPLTI
jgi:hypothetical protein